MVESMPTAVDKNRRVKTALIPVLALILLWVLFGSSDETGVPDAAAANSVAVDSVTTVVTPSTDADEVVRPRVAVAETQKLWPQIPLDETLLHNPFAPTRSDESSSNEDSQIDSKVRPDPQTRLKQLVAALQQDGLSIVFETGEGKTAVIGSRVIHEGDMLDETTRVVEIYSDRLVLERVQ